jgi:hypothetical protein
MRIKKSTIVFFFLLSASVSFGQKGNNQFIASLEVGVPTGDFKNFKTGVGASLEALLGVGNHGQVGFTTGYSSFKLKGGTSSFKQKLSVIPFMFGYRYKAPLIYFEPQIGYGVYSSTIKRTTGGTDTKTSSSNGGFTWAIGTGIQLKFIDLGIRYQAGYPGGGDIGLFGFHAGYVFKSKKS